MICDGPQGGRVGVDHCPLLHHFASNVTSVAEPKNAFRGDCYVMIKRTALILSAATLSFESKQPLGIAVIDHVAMRRWAIEPVKEFRRHLVGAERMVGPK